MSYRVLQYQVKAEPVPLGAKETITPDKWQGELPDNPVRHLSSCALLSAIAFVPIVSTTTTTPVYVNSQACEPTKVEHVQYQAKAEPIMVPAPSAETVTSDKWDREQSRPVFQVKRSATFPAYVADKSSLLAPERPDVDKWVVKLEQPRQDLKRQQQTYPSLFAEQLFAVPSTATPVYVSAQACEPISVVHFQYPGITQPIFVPTATPETITADKWAGTWPQPSFRPKRLIQYGINIAIAEQVDDGLPPVHWQQPTSAPLRSIRPNVATGLSELRQAVFLETATFDKWALATQEPRRDVARRQYIYQVAVSDYLSQVPGAEVIRLDKWNKNFPDQNFRLKRLSDYGYSTLDPTLRTERITLDKWAQLQSEPRRDIRKQQYVFPVSASDYLSQVPGAEVIRIDKWLVRPYERFAQRRLPPNDLTGQFILASALPQTGWYQPQEVPVRTLEKLQNLYPHLAIDTAFWLVLSGPTDFLAYDRDFGIIALRMEDSGTLALLTTDVGTTELQTNNVGTIAILTEDFGVLD